MHAKHLPLGNGPCSSPAHSTCSMLASCHARHNQLTALIPVDAPTCRHAGCLAAAPTAAAQHTTLRRSRTACCLTLWWTHWTSMCSPQARTACCGSGMWPQARCSAHWHPRQGQVRTCCMMMSVVDPADAVAVAAVAVALPGGQQAA
jgi:hypothetical protein